MRDKKKRIDDSGVEIPDLPANGLLTAGLENPFDDVEDVLVYDEDTDEFHPLGGAPPAAIPFPFEEDDFDEDGSR